MALIHSSAAQQLARTGSRGAGPCGWASGALRGGDGERGLTVWGSLATHLGRTLLSWTSLTLESHTPVFKGRLYPVPSPLFPAL